MATSMGDNRTMPNLALTKRLSLNRHLWFWEVKD